MEAVKHQWENAETEVEEEGLLQRPARLKSNTNISNTTHAIEAFEHTNGSSGFKDGGLEFSDSQSKINSSEERMDISVENLSISLNAAIKPQNQDNERIKILPASDLPSSEHPTSVNNVSNESGRVVIMNQDGQEVQELILERVFQKAPTHGFYCPNCDTCIQKVLIYNIEWKETIAPAHPRPTNTFRCTSCFSFLIPIGSWLFPCLIPNEDTAPTVEGPPYQATKGAPENKAPAAGVSWFAAKGPSKPAIDTATDSGIQNLQLNQEIIEGANKVDIKVEDKTRDSSNYLSEIIPGESGQHASRNESSVVDWAVIARASVAFKPKQHETKIDSSANLKQPPELEQIVVDKDKLAGKLGDADTAPASTITVHTVTDTTTGSQEPGSSKTLEILKSIVYGGLTESIASLSVVTSSASADASTLNIIALAFANLIGGLFILGHNLWDLHAEQPKKANNQTNATVDRYNELLGDKKNFILHASVAILSFLIFGLVPPAVYGFSFYNSDDKDYKLAAVAGASLLSIVLLSVAKAYIQRPNSYLTYFKTIFYYVSTAGLASVVSYIAGDLIRKLVEKLGWFKSSSSTFALPLPEMNMDKHRWESYR